MNKIGIIVQARTSSTRLPNKVIRPFYNEMTLLEIIINNLSKYFQKSDIIIATTTNPLDDIMEEIANKCGINLFRGEEENVLKRYIDAAEKFAFSRIIRICSDNPFLDMKALNQLYSQDKLHSNDYIGYSVNKQPAIKTHYGFWAESVLLSALRKALRLNKEKRYQEHVTNYIYENPDIFKIKWIEAPGFLKSKNLRFTIDTIEDFELQQLIYNKLIEREEEINIRNLYHIIDSNPYFAEIMRKQILVNQK
ncbi:MAG: glycosyl transferase family 2 [Bacteroidales bacterium]|nr:glycosyl transferase family 2 [Bacteroidales bacterium]